MEIQSNMPISPQPEQLPIPKPKKWFQHKGIITIVILIILTVLVSWLALSREPKTELTAVNVTQNSKSVNNYTNNFLHYSLSYPNSWRVAASYSKKLAILKKYSYYAEKSQCFISPDESDEQRAINSLNQCISSKPDFKNFEAEFKDFQLSWKPENSEVIVFTDLSDTAEQTFVNQITAHEKTYLDFPVAYHFIQL
ncbi:MAG: hypothetical protein M1383_01760, partial [Patescibacteria group bacterium]|nr:hypothetical protein [Patescibacteria group bacterium]